MIDDENSVAEMNSSYEEIMQHIKENERLTDLSQLSVSLLAEPTEESPKP